MSEKLNIKLAFLLLLVTSHFAKGQYISGLSKLNPQIDVKVKTHLWLDGKNYQFIAVSVTGLPEINTAYSWQPSDTVINYLIDLDTYGGCYSPPVLLSRNETFHPIKTMKETVYDSLSKSNKVRVTSLFLWDDFEKVKKKETLFLTCQGVFGYSNRSQAYFDTFVSELILNGALLKGSDSCPLADKKWYKAWLKNAPTNYWNPRGDRPYSEQHQNYQQYLEKYKRPK